LALPENLVSNPGFESGVTKPDYWEPMITGTAVATHEWDAVDRYSGARSAKCTIVRIDPDAYGGAYWRQRIPKERLVEGGTYALRDKYKANRSSNLRVVVADSAWQLISGQYFGCPASLDWSNSGEFIFTFPSGTDWQRAFYIYIMHEISGAPGMVFDAWLSVDDFELYRTAALTWNVTLESSPTGVQFVQPPGTAPFTVTVMDGENVTVEVPREIQVETVRYSFNHWEINGVEDGSANPSSIGPIRADSSIRAVYLPRAAALPTLLILVGAAACFSIGLVALSFAKR